jgi:coenzyme F420 hydrogenase subunit beta
LNYCPKRDWSTSNAELFTFGRECKANEAYGVCRRIILTRATDQNVLKVAQDGGAATALLLYTLRSGLIARAVVSGIDPNRPLYPVPKVATTAEDIIACAGTRYFYSPNILALNEAAKEKSNIGFVGTPCQISAIRKAQATELKRYGAVKLIVGLMCSECFDYEGLVKTHLQQKLGIDPRHVLKINMKGKLNLTMKDGQAISLPLAEVKRYARKTCARCHDFSATLADISVGGLGLDGWTFTIIRSQLGEEIFSAAEKSGIIETRNAREETQALNLLTKLSIKKRCR